MYKLLVVFYLSVSFFILPITIGFAQSKAPSSSIETNTTGNSFNIGSMIIDWNIGQVFAKSFTDQMSLLLTSGFLQPKDFEKIMNPSLDSLSNLDLKYNLISVYPNPTNSHVYIFNAQERIKIVEMSLLNMKGELVNVFYPPFSTPSFKKKIALSNLVTGTYVLMLNYIIDNRYYRTKYLRIIKI